ncbi:hypothetical protein CVU37_10890 [candidate division BRC1 bacterium HGW-BRC1-1]|jgi:aminoglycoside 3-N-acetyltransferase|nr:MAG: hypothetical protein CVU37_10890 [candidate division BRC1 bacterium HGW-BRC1-1]
MNEALPETTRDDLIRDLHLSGISRGDNVILHSSLKSLGNMRGGADAVVDAFVEVIGPSGNLMVPTFTYSIPKWMKTPFDVQSSVSQTGAITESVRRNPAAKRSFHPTHSVAVLGPDAEEITADHMQATAIGLASPFGKMHKSGAKIVMLGTNQTSNSSLHYCEVHAAVPYLPIAFSDEVDYETAWFLNENRHVEYCEIHEVPGCSRGFENVEDELAQLGVMRRVKIGPTMSQVLALRALVEAMDTILTRDPELLLCGLPYCAICPKRRERVRRVRL